MARRSRKLYDQDGTTLIYTPSDETMPVADGPIKTVNRSHSSKNTTISTVDAFKTVVGYIKPIFDLGSLDSGEPGECLICGASTMKENRKLCVDCMQKHGEALVEKTISAIEARETTFDM